MKANHQHWQADDLTLLDEHADVINLVHEKRFDVAEETPPAHLDNYVRQIALSKSGEPGSNHWILGQGPLVVLVTCIFFAIAIMWLAG